MAEYIKLEALKDFPIRKDHCDKERANEHFIFGIESVLEYAENLPAADVVPVSELLILRDALYENDQITMRGLAMLNMLIAKYGGYDHG